MGRILSLPKKEMLENTLQLGIFLPDALLDHFTIIEVKELGLLSSKEMIYVFYLDEDNTIPSKYNSDEYESKGFGRMHEVQDFPIRGKACYLFIRRRRWRHKVTKEEIRNDYSFISEGSKLTQELSDFLKETGRDPGRYDK